MKIKFNSKALRFTRVRVEKWETPATKNKYKNANIRNIAPNCVQKNIR